MFCLSVVKGVIIKINAYYSNVSASAEQEWVALKKSVRPHQKHLCFAWFKTGKY
jgi:hypothetical protein